MTNSSVTPPEVQRQEVSLTPVKSLAEYLPSRGVNLRVQDRLGIYKADTPELSQLGIEWSGMLQGLVFPIPGIDGKPTGKVGARVFYAGSGFGIAVKGKPKFLTPAGQYPSPYFCPLNDWSRLEFGQRIYICESYVKAVVCALNGNRHAIGVSGVWGWSHDKQPLAEFDLLPWKARRLRPVVIFDSNVNPDRPELMKSVERLAAFFEARYGVKLTYIRLPTDPSGADWGLDDYAMHHGADKLGELLDGKGAECSGTLTDHMNVMNSEVIVVRNIQRFVEINTGYIMNTAGFTGVNYAPRVIWKDDKPIPVAKSWIAWPGRREVPRMEYTPGAPRVVDGEFYNLWPGMGCSPKEGDVALLLDWADQVFADSAQREYFFNWFAYLVQNPGAKLTTSVLLFGTSGIGKGWWWEVMRRIFGKNAVPIALDELAGNFNAHWALSQLLGVEEAAESNSKDRNWKRVYSLLKNLITGAELPYNQKNEKVVMVANHTNVYIMANDLAVLPLDEFDRRMAVIELGGEDIANSAAFWGPMWAWLDRGGAEAIYAWLLGRDLSAFNPKGEAPASSAKLDMAELGQTSLERWVRELKQNPESVMVFRGQRVDGTVASAKELYFIYRGGEVSLNEVSPEQAKWMANELNKQRIPKANDGGKIKGPQGTARYFLVAVPAGARLPWQPENWSEEVLNRAFWKVRYEHEQKLGG